ncbi:MAG: hypothetical protein US57_C0003G0011 [Candidatus Moranbacteria bacterium GW2011_GWC2_37_73]|nr:MAG: hypothetical protein UR95_C0003G0048 [Parcubacteria group bacterium GW2011_GWC1_36_108]KKQ01249.1 MAG: hypothetical protein US09_C0001G0009 [Candidatus Moranbacteria bacterium GW2011_GWD1_36_198]KKQ02308.1 MAG: hypothetical protein US10_C0003G0009 [Candidatus Moranbacteria bacterium GW2011_GWD2_36_198]KKQ40203.1 MAG: hypothetical protein US57_C0003G0011 [Candidatus Moranbacteria bacterium GW2011_GWC2_37_73]HAR99705.1 hypothetical protein [Candidatus Moranbacteria bacterium]
MFKHHKKKNPFLYHLISGIGLIIFWRGIWGIMDLYLFPGNPTLSHSFAITLGLVILYFNDFSISELIK